jgi:putative polyhydroxyalkanoate system protein
MSTIRIEREYRQSQAELKQGLETLGSRFKEKYDVDYKWHGQRVEFKRSGVNGFIEYDDKMVRLEMKLGLMFAPFASKVRSQLEEYVEEHIAAK